MKSDAYNDRYPQRIPAPDSGRDLERPEWMEEFDPSALTMDEIASRLKDRLLSLPDFLPSPTGSNRPAAVLVPLIEIECNGTKIPGLLLTRRSWHLKSHRGEVSFPGGGVEQGETFTLAALRETEEEIGVPRSEIELVGALSEGTTMSFRNNFRPVVGIMRGHHLAGESDEVDGILRVTLEDLIDPDRYHREYWKRSSPVQFEAEMHFFELDDDLLWGASSRIVYDILRIVAER